MAIDSRIALGVRPMADPMQAYGQALSLKSLMGQQQMQQMQMQAMQQERADQLALRDLMRQPGTDDERIDRLMQAGHIQPALQLRKHALDSRKTHAEIEKTTLEAGAMAAKQFADAMAGVNSQESYQAVVASLARNPAFGPMVQNLPGQWTPEFGQQAVRQAMIAHGKIAETLAKFENRDLGGQLQTVRRDPITGVEQVVGAVDKTATPGDVLADARGRASNAIAAGNLAVSRDRLAFDKSSPRLTPVETSGGLVGYDPRSNTFVPAQAAGVAQPSPQPGAQAAPQGAAPARPADFGQPALGKPAAQLKAEVETIEREQGKAKTASVAADTLAVLDKAIAHPGRSISTGGTSLLQLDRVPGTDAADFRAVRKQLEGKAFLQAFDTLKGGGQITEIEGRKATEAIARLDTAQSDGEYLAALNELRGIVAAGYERATGKPYAASSGSAKPGVRPPLSSFGGK